MNLDLSEVWCPTQAEFDAFAALSGDAGLTENNPSAARTNHAPISPLSSSPA